MSLQGKVVLITGAASGIGLATATELLRSDVEGLVLTDIDETLGLKSLKALHDEFAPERVIFMKLDTTNEEEYEGAFRKAISTYGSLDIVINNAGMVNEIDYCRTVNVNLIGKLRGTILGLKYMGKDQGGRGGVILNTASMAALTTYVSPVYSATKFGVLGLSLNYGKKLYYDSTGVRVIALCPGYTETKLMLDHQPENKYIEKMWHDMATIHPRQKIDSVAKAAVYAIVNGESGSAWVINESKLYKANIPDWAEYCELVDPSV